MARVWTCFNCFSVGVSKLSPLIISAAGCLALSLNSKDVVRTGVGPLRGKEKRTHVSLPTQCYQNSRCNMNLMFVSVPRGLRLWPKAAHMSSGLVVCRLTMPHPFSSRHMTSPPLSVWRTWRMTCDAAPLSKVLSAVSAMAPFVRAAVSAGVNDVPTESQRNATQLEHKDRCQRLTDAAKSVCPEASEPRRTFAAALHHLVIALLVGRDEDDLGAEAVPHLLQ